MNVETFWNLLPIPYFIGEYEKEDCRSVEIDTEFRILFCKTIGINYLKNSIALTREEQETLDCEIATMLFGFEGSTVRNLMAWQLNRDEKQIEETLDKVEAKCHFRNILGIDPLPPRYYPDRFNRFLDNFFGMEF